MQHMKLSVRIALATIIPFVLTTCWVVVLDNLKVRVFLANLAPLDTVFGVVALLTSAGAGYWFIVQPATWKTRQDSERLLLVIVGVAYFPVIVSLMMYWSLIVAGSVYGAWL